LGRGFDRKFVIFGVAVLAQLGNKIFDGLLLKCTECHFCEGGGKENESKILKMARGETNEVMAALPL